MIKLTSKLKVHENLNMDHRTVLKVMDLIENVNLFLPLKHKLIEKLVFKEIPTKDEEAKEQLTLFFDALKVEEEKTKTNKRKTLDLLKDYQYIYQSFALIGIDLNVDKIHWYKFNEILQGLLLRGENPIAKVVEIRNLNANDYPKEKRSEIRSIQRQFALEEDEVLDNADDFIMAFKSISKPKQEVK